MPSLYGGLPGGPYPEFRGDGVVDPPNRENCDDGNILTGVCPYGDAFCQVCAANCEPAMGQSVSVVITG